MIHTVSITAISLYALSAVAFLLQLWGAPPRGKRQLVAFWSCVVAVVFHTILMVLVVQDARFVLMQSGADLFLWVSWIVAVLFLVLRRRLNYPIIGSFVVPAIVLFIASSSFVLHLDSSAGGSDPQLASRGLLLPLFHGVPALLSMVCMALAFVVSIVFLIVEKRLKRRKGTDLSSAGPNLQTLDHLNRHFAQGGFLAISLVVISGGIWSVMEHRALFSSDLSVVAGIVTWVLLAFILHGRFVLRWSPRKLSRVTAFTAGVFFLSLFIVLLMDGRISHAPGVF
jgi:ABC-type uncharacterized transport system permease subunit